MINQSESVSGLKPHEKLLDWGVTTTALRVFYKKLCCSTTEAIDIIETLIFKFFSLVSFPKWIFAERFPEN